MSAVIDLPPVWGEKLTKGLLTQTHRESLKRLHSPTPDLTGRSLRGSFRAVREDMKRTARDALIADWVFGEGKRSRLVYLSAEVGDDIQVAVTASPIRLIVDRSKHPMRVGFLGGCTNHAAVRIAAEFKKSSPKAVGRLLLPHLLNRHYAPETASVEGLAFWNEDGQISTFIARERLDKHQKTYDAAVARQGHALSVNQALDVLRFRYSNPTSTEALPIYKP